MLEFVPRATYKREKDDKTIYSNDFIPVSNGEAGQKSKKTQTTTLPKEITMNMLVRDRWKYRDIAQQNVWRHLFEQAKGFLLKEED